MKTKAFCYINFFLNFYFYNFTQPDRIKQEGYPVEEHEVVTDDGYILTLFRIPFGKKSPQTEKPRPPVLLAHALLESSNSYIALGPDNSLGNKSFEFPNAQLKLIYKIIFLAKAYLLADAGYDVWLGNPRGTKPSRRHVRLKPTGWWQKEFWSFSFHELGKKFQ